MFLLPLDVRLDELVAPRVFYRLHGRRDLLRGQDETSRWPVDAQRGAEACSCESHRASARIQVVQVRVAFVLERLRLAVVARRQERVLHQARAACHELERPLDLASPEDDPDARGRPTPDEVRDERARAERAGLSEE